MSDASILGMSMEAQALANIREKRKRKAQSSIFDGSEKKQSTQQVESHTPKNLDNQIDLTILQDEAQQEQYTEVDDELDILETYIDPFDVKAQVKKAKLMEEIESEKQKIKCKFLFKYGRQESDPFKL